MPSALQDLYTASLQLISDNAGIVPFLVFALGFGESLVLVSLFVPSTALFLAIGTAHAAVGGVFWPVWFAGAAGAIAGDIVSFAAGRYFRDDLPRIWPFSRYPDLFPRCRLLFRRWGLFAILAGKFMGTARPFLPVVAGAMVMRWPDFILASVVSSLAWAGVFLAPGYGIAAFWNPSQPGASAG